MLYNRIISTLSTISIIFGISNAAEQISHGKDNTSSQVDISSKNIDYTPHIHGVVRTRWEGEWGKNLEFQQRFQVRNARLSVAGNVLPTVDYFIQIDACDRGKMKILDAWGQWSFSSSWKIRAGQFRVPYAVDCFRAPGNYIFANRSFMAKDMLNMREVGMKIGYFGQSVPIIIEGGVFNSAGISDHDVWQRAMTYAAKALYKVGNVTVSTSYISTKPDCVRMNMADGAITWESERWIVEGEYQSQHYTHKSHKNTHGWDLFASYSLPLTHRTFNNLSFQARYDGMTDHSTGKNNEQGNLETNDPTRQRITIGTTLEFIQKPVRVATRLNYEKVFFKDSATAPRGKNDKIVAELVVKF